MGKFNRTDQEAYRQSNADELHERAEKRIRDAVEALENTAVSFDMDKITEEEGDLKRFKRNASSGLAAILAAAAAAEAKAKGG